MTVLKFSIMASRAVELAAHVGHRAGDQHRVEAALAQLRGEIRRALDEGAVAHLLDDQVLRQHLEIGQQLVALTVNAQRAPAPLGALAPTIR